MWDIDHFPHILKSVVAAPSLSVVDRLSDHRLRYVDADPAVRLGFYP